MLLKGYQCSSTGQTTVSELLRVTYWRCANHCMHVTGDKRNKKNNNFNFNYHR